MINGGVECGPNAVLAMAREGYRKTHINPGELFSTLTYPGFIRLAKKHWRAGMGEVWRSVSKAAFTRALQRLVPAVQEEDLESGGAGVRAQALSIDGSMLDDFSFEEGTRILSVVNAPSPGATASLALGRIIADKLAERF
jgi:L-2-hydroxyglutarate oxidase